MGFQEEAFVDAVTEEEDLKAILGAEMIILQLIKLGKEKIQDNDNEIQVKPNYHCCLSTASHPWDGKKKKRVDGGGVCLCMEKKVLLSEGRDLRMTREVEGRKMWDITKQF